MTEAAEPVSIYYGDDVEASYLPGEGQTLFVTFTNFADRDRRGAGFGKDLFRKHQIPAVMFTSARNHWWQTPEILGAIAAIRDAGIMDRYPHRLGYGSSMGAYGALLFSKPLGLTEIRAFSPQFSIDPAKAPFETRFLREAAQISFVHDDMNAALSDDADITIFYDPMDLDGAHLHLFDGKPSTRLVRFGFAGHPVTHLLQEMGLLKRLVERGPLSDDALRQIQRDYRTARRKAYPPLLNLCRSLAERGRYRALRASAERAVTLKPEDPRAVNFQSLAAEKLGDLASAIAHTQRSATLTPDNRATRRRLGQLQTTAGDFAEAEKILSALLAETPQDVLCLRDLAVVKRHQGVEEAALELLKSALALEPENHSLQWLMRSWQGI